MFKHQRAFNDRTSQSIFGFNEETKAPKDVNDVRGLFSRYCLSRLPLFLVSIMITCVYAIVTFVIILPKIRGKWNPLGILGIEKDPVAGWCYLLVFNLLFSLALVSYYRAVRTLPGSIPSWLWSDGRPSDLHSYQTLIQSVQRKKDGRVRYCRKCRAFKPDRTHHNHAWNRCVLQLQFYSWLCNNCIGFYNYKYYLLCMLYTTGCNLVTVILLSPPMSKRLALYVSMLKSGYFLQDLLQLLRLRDGSSAEAVDFSILVVFVLSVVVFFICGGNTLFHLHLILSGRTYKEWAHPPNQLDMDYCPNYFDYGPKLNLTLCLGEYPLLWLVPSTKGLQGNGIFFPANPSIILNDDNSAYT